MRKKISIQLLIFLLIAVSVNAQGNFNYVKSKTWLYESSGSIPNDVPAVTVDEITYFDEISRPIQIIGIKHSPSKKDIVNQTIIYNEFEQPTKTYSPYMTNQNNGSYRNSFHSEALNFYNVSSSDDVVNTPYPFAESIYEQSSLNKVIEGSFPGEDWQVGANTVTNKLLLNTCGGADDDNVINFLGSADLDESVYPEGELYKEVIYDEDNRVLITFSDKLGREILSRRIGEDNIRLDTYYLYNSFGSVSTIIQPEGSALYNYSGNCSGFTCSDLQSLELFLFKYKYDEKQRLIEKKTLDEFGNTEYYVYDQLNRLRFKTNHKLLSDNGKWEFFLYDKLDRVVIKGITIFNINGVQYFNANGLLSSTDLILVRTYLGLLLEGSAISISRDNQVSPSYTNNSFPNFNGNAVADVEIYEVNYFDDYNFNDADINLTNLNFEANTGFDNLTVRNDDVLGKKTASKTRLLVPENFGTINEDWLANVTYYDFKYRPIQVHANNQVGGYDKHYEEFRFSGKLNRNKHVQTTAGNKTYTIDHSFTYDHVERLKDTYIKFNNAIPKLTSSLEYNSIGQLKRKKLHKTRTVEPCDYLSGILVVQPSYDDFPTTINSISLAKTTLVPHGGYFTQNTTSQGCFLQYVDYKYNERGWLTDINDIAGINGCKILAGKEIMTAIVLNNLPLKPKTKADISNITLPKAYGKSTSIEDYITKLKQDNTEESHINKAFINEHTGLWSYDFKTLVEYADKENFDIIRNEVIDSVKIFIEKNAKLFELDKLNEIEEPIVETTIQLEQRLYYSSCKFSCIVVNKDLFAEAIAYNKPRYDLTTFTPQYNGNISAVIWESDHLNMRAYKYEYDNLNRLTDATYDYYDGFACSWVDNQPFNSNHYGVNNISYDLNGNLLRLTRKGKTYTQQPLYDVIDNFYYVYNGNTLLGVNDTDINHPTSQIYNDLHQNTAFSAFYYNALTDYVNDGVAPTTTTMNPAYQYDKHGNLTRDENKGTTINYNHLNLPETISFDGGQKIELVYTANGTKKIKKLYDPTTGETKLHYYVNGFEYTKDTNNGTGINASLRSVTMGNTISYNLLAYYHSEGRITLDVGLQYEYTLKDHLGNSRVTFTDDGTGHPRTLQENHYYPFGLDIEGLDYNRTGQKDNKYQYNNKELTEEFGLHWNDYGARWYDPQIARWHSVDPLADLEPSLTPYRYGFNNPISFIDPDGLFEKKADAKKYARRNGIKTGWFRRNKIVGNSDGSFSIDNKREFSSISLDKELGVVTDALITAGRFTEAGTYSVSMNGAMAGGFGLELGLARDNHNSFGLYFRFSGEIGFGGGVGFGYQQLTPTEGKKLRLSDIEGDDFESSIEVGPLSYTPTGGNQQKGADRVREYGDKYTIGGGSIATIGELKRWKAKPKLSIGLRGSYGTTWFLFKKQKE